MPIVADQFGQLSGQRHPLAVVLAGLTRVEADVLQEQHVAVGEPFGAGQRIGTDHVGAQLDVSAQLFIERRRDRFQAVKDGGPGAAGLHQSCHPQPFG